MSTAKDQMETVIVEIDVGKTSVVSSVWEFFNDNRLGVKLD